MNQTFNFLEQNIFLLLQGIPVYIVASLPEMSDWEELTQNHSKKTDNSYLQ